MHEALDAPEINCEPLPQPFGGTELKGYRKESNYQHLGNYLGNNIKIKANFKKMRKPFLEWGL